MSGRPVIGGTSPMIKLSTYANKICKMDFFDQNWLSY